MPEVHPKYEDEIDLIDILKTLWLSKKVISIFIILALLIGSCFLFFKDPSYESKLTFHIGDIPPFYEEEKVSAEFINLFYSRKTFELIAKKLDLNYYDITPSFHILSKKNIASHKLKICRLDRIGLHKFFYTLLKSKTGLDHDLMIKKP